MSFKVRDLVYIGIFGALWGVIEITLGDLLHAIGSVPFTGSIVATFGIAVALVGRLFVPQRGATLMTGAVALLIKMLSPSGQAIPSVMLAILAQSLLIEVGLLALGQGRRIGFVFAGALAVAWNMVHPFVSGALIYGRQMLEVYQSTLERGADTLGLDPSVVWLVLGLLLLIRIVMGAIGGWIAWDVGGLVQRRMGRTEVSPVNPVE
jgi:ABC-type thiamin/hydroxymethylpyrimidine transport system permease subunit